MSWLFGGKKDSIAAVVDIHSSSISAGYVYVSPGKAPVVIETVTYPLDAHATEPLTESVPRVLQLALNSLTQSGAPKVREYAGHSRVSKVIVSISAPWHTHQVSIHEKKSDKPFTVTSSLIEELVPEGEHAGKANTMSNQKVVSVYLNGYETPDPYGKRASHVEVIALTSTVDATFYASVGSIIRSAFHSKNIWITSFITEFYFAYRDLFPHQRDYILLDVGSTSIDIICVKHALLVWSGSSQFGADVAIAPLKERGVDTTDVSTSSDVSLTPGWTTAFVDSLHEDLRALSHEEALPSLVLYNASKKVCDLMSQALGDERLTPLWLTNNPPSSHAVSGGEFSRFVSVAQGVVVPTELYALALSLRHKES